MRETSSVFLLIFDSAGAPKTSPEGKLSQIDSKRRAVTDEGNGRKTHDFASVSGLLRVGTARQPSSVFKIVQAWPILNPPFPWGKVLGRMQNETPRNSIFTRSIRYGIIFL